MNFLGSERILSCIYQSSMLKRPSSNCDLPNFVSLCRWIDDQNVSSSPDLTIEENDNHIVVIMKPSLPSGRHKLRCMVTNPSRNRQTLLERVFDVHSNHTGSFIHQFSATSHAKLARRMLQDSSSNMTCYALEYPMSGRTHMLMQIDWSHLMLLLNPLIILIILLFYWGCRKIGLNILHKHMENLTSSSWFFVSDRQAKYTVFKQFFGSLPSWLGTCCSRLFLFTSDDVLFYGVLASLLLHLIIPVIFRDARVILRLFVHS